MINIKEAVKYNVKFDHYREGVMYYKTQQGDIFGVPLDDVGNATLGNVEKGILMMRYMRKHNDLRG